MLALLGVAAATGAAADDPFDVLELPVKGRIVAAGIADLDADARPDLWTIGFRGVPPAEPRALRGYFQRAEGGFGIAADWTLPLPDDTAAWDQGVLEPPGPIELLLLRRDRVTRLALPGRKPLWRDVALGGPTLAVAPDERGLDRVSLLRTDLTPWPVLTVPGLGELALVRPSGAVVSRLQVGARANYFIPPRPGPLISESELEVYVDHPRISLGDVDGDGLQDVIATDRHALQVFRQAAGGEFAPLPSRTVPLRRLSSRDHVRGSGSVRVSLADLDGNGLVDLLVNHAAEGLLDARSETTVHLNRQGEWNLAEPDQRFVTEGAFTTEELRDLDGDGRAEMVTVRIPLGVLELAEILITRSVDANVSVRRATAGGFAEAPLYQRKFSVPFSFETFRPRGFLGNVSGDWNGDGRMDLLLSGNGEAVEVHLGEPDGGFAGRPTRQKLDTGGRIRLGDVDGDGLVDFVLFDPRRPDVPVRVARNRGVLPGTPSRPTMRSIDDDG